MEDAENYANSYAMRFSKFRSEPGSFRTDFFPKSDPRALVHRKRANGPLLAAS